MTTAPPLMLTQLFKRHPGAPRPVLDGCALSLDAGELVAVMGRSGVGKSSLMAIAGGLDTDHGGEVRWSGQSLTGLDDAALSRLRHRHTGFVFQAFHLLPHLSVRRNVALAAQFGSLVEDTSSVDARADTLLDEVGLGGLGARRAGELSGGERQRVALARALFSEPSLLLADEPTGNLDDTTADAVAALLDRLRRERSLAVLMVTHEARLARRADRVLRLEGGQLHPEGA